MTINSAVSEFVGLFGVNSGTIENTGLIGDSLTGSGDVGGLVGHNLNMIFNTYATGTVTGIAIRN